jgi:polynucleotide 5'-hydroxyl-kinase GRC3/NOL9
MSESWAEKTAKQVLRRALLKRGVCLIIGGVDTGKTSLAESLARGLANQGPVGLIDADVGQSDIGPPATIAWALFDNPEMRLSGLTARGMCFVGDVTPVRHLLQFTAGVRRCLDAVSKTAEVIIVDTPGFIAGRAAAALWWTVQQVLRPQLIVALYRRDELDGILSGIRGFDCQLEMIKSPENIPLKSPQQRQDFRSIQFAEYFRNARSYDINLNQVAIQSAWNLSNAGLAGHLAGLRDRRGDDIAIGVITNWDFHKGLAVIRAPEVDIGRVRGLVIGDVTVSMGDEYL